MPWAFAAAGGLALASGAISSAGAKSAAKTQAAATQRGMDQSIASQKEGLTKAEGYLTPYAALGTEALPTVKSLLGLGPEGSAGMMSTLEKYPGYQFAVDQGEKQIANQQIAAGSKYSGNALKAASGFNRDAAASLFNDYYGKIFGLMNTGKDAATGLANASIGVGTNVGQTQYGGNVNIGEAKSAGIIGSTNAWTNAIDQIAGAASGVGGGWGNLFSSPASTAAPAAWATSSSPQTVYRG